VTTQSTAPSPSRAADEAVAWFVRQDAGPLSREEATRFAAWQSEPANASAYERVAGLWGEFDRVPEEARPALPEPAMAASLDQRRHRSWWPRAWQIGAALAACLLLGIFAPSLSVRWRADLATRIGEIKTATLLDGSTITLDTNTAVAVDFRNGERKLRLLTGEAEFQVAPDAAHPFVVEAAGGATRALGTAFTVRRDGDIVTVTGIEHRVEISYPASGADTAAATLGPGEQLRYGAAIGLGAVAAVGADADAWRRGRLIVENRPLGEVVAELDRYHRGHIQLLGDAVARLNVNGVFPVTDTRASIDALSQSLGLKAIWLTDYLVIVSR
jgi:transmembrane sensor